MSFLRPEFLWALPLVAVPVLIHLLNRRRYRVVEFAAMDFLRRALKRTRRRLLLEDLLLLLLRTLAVLALILALARPGAAPGGLLTGRAARGEVLVLDASMSMALRQGGSSPFDRAVAEGLRRLARLAAAEGDRAALVRAGPRPLRLALGDPDEVRAALQEQVAPDPGRADLAGALAVARASADALAAEVPGEVEVILLTDLQAGTLDLEGDLAQVLVDLAGRGLPLRLVDCGRPGASNTAVVDLEVEPVEALPGAFVEVQARIRHYGPEPRRGLRATLLLDGVPLTSTTLDLAPGEERSWSHSFAPAEAGSRALELRLDGDALPADDSRARILPVRPAPAVLLVGEPVPEGDPEGVHDVLLGYLDLGPDGPVHLATTDPGRLDARRLEQIDVVVLADPGRLPTGSLEALAAFREGGGGVLLALGPVTEPPAAHPLLRALGLAGSLEIGGVANSGGPGGRLEILDRRHPALSLFRDPRWRPLLEEVPHRRYRELRLAAPPPAGTEPPRQLLRLVRSTGEGPGQVLGPALLAWELPGRLAILATPPLPAWNRMLEVPGGTLPLLVDLVAWLAPRPGHPRDVEVGAPLAVELPRPPTEILVRSPGGSTLRPAAPARLRPGGRAWQDLVAEALAAGVWRVEARMVDSRGVEEVFREPLAVNVPPLESNPARADTERLLSLYPGLRIERAGGGEEEASDPLGAGQGRPEDLSDTFYLLLAACLVGETLLAAWLDRRRG